jgi:hypothetical protein
MGIDEAGHDDAVGRVDDLGVARRDRRADRDDPLVLDQDVAAEDVADLRIHAQHMSSTEQHAVGHEPSPFARWHVQRPITLH